jgi:uncharacterized protein YbaR (Trm112 family)
MKKNNDIVCCPLDKGEVFPYQALMQQTYSKEKSHKQKEKAFRRECYQEMLDNYHNTH